MERAQSVREILEYKELACATEIDIAQASRIVLPLVSVLLQSKIQHILGRESCRGAAIGVADSTIQIAHADRLDVELVEPERFLASGARAHWGDASVAWRE